ncbi:hypothetical protein M422DRAFT_45839 [Sphaerobolus stellatus SS14]|nr:hypothetical protein M422DRAFT_45839 [Sphaerobolus stellatus SS14]
MDAVPLNRRISDEWEQKYLESQLTLEETRQILEEFQQSSKELEDELTLELEQTERAQRELQAKAKFLSLQTTHYETTTTSQKEINDIHQQLKRVRIQLREVEMSNDDLERSERQIQSDFAAIETKYVDVLDSKVMLEQELQEKIGLEERLQRAQDELSGVLHSSLLPFSTHILLSDMDEDLTYFKRCLKESDRKGRDVTSELAAVKTQYADTLQEKETLQQQLLEKAGLDQQLQRVKQEPTTANEIILSFKRYPQEIAALTTSQPQNCPSLSPYEAVNKIVYSSNAVPVPERPTLSFPLAYDFSASLKPRPQTAPSTPLSENDIVIPSSVPAPELSSSTSVSSSSRPTAGPTISVGISSGTTNNNILQKLKQMRRQVHSHLQRITKIPTSRLTTNSDRQAASSMSSSSAAPLRATTSEHPIPELTKEIPAPLKPVSSQRDGRVSKANSVNSIQGRMATSDTASTSTQSKPKRPWGLNYYASGLKKKIFNKGHSALEGIIESKKRKDADEQESDIVAGPSHSRLGFFKRRRIEKEPDEEPEAHQELGYEEFKKDAEEQTDEEFAEEPEAEAFGSALKKRLLSDPKEHGHRGIFSSESSKSAKPPQPPKAKEKHFSDSSRATRDPQGTTFSLSYSQNQTSDRVNAKMPNAENNDPADPDGSDDPLLLTN